MTNITIDNRKGDKSIIIGNDCNGATKNIWVVMSTGNYIRQKESEGK